ncbi:hypothetical protein OENI_10085 [Oenococcus oeni]|nr:hypothetical protein [Oenococcus oeni]SYW00384.1 hypothetical protein OENI_10085 [Oenococcus oeni]SYW07225.1 hypothetical protein OENI_10065 [Oenococcus oeni]
MDSGEEFFSQPFEVTVQKTELEQKEKQRAELMDGKSKEVN